MTTIDELTIKLNPLIERAERAIARLYTLPAEIPLTATKRLRYGKNGREWRLLLVDYGDGSELPLVQGSRAQRLEALANLPYLVAAIDEELKLQSERAARIVELAEAFLAGLECRKEASK